MIWGNASIHLSPEQELVLASIRLDRTKDGRIAELLQQQLDWERVFKYAYLHNVLPLIYERLNALGAEQARPDEMSRLKVLYLTGFKRNLRLAQKLEEVVQLLSSQGIESLVFKGPALALQAYGNLSLRSFEDLDILLRQEDIPRLYDLLTQSGYTPMSQMDGAEQAWWMRSTSHLVFMHHGDLMEFHWMPMEKGFIYPIQTAHFWQDLHSFPLFEQEVQTLSAENNLILLCLHGSKHEWYQLKWIADLAYLIQSSPDLAWSAILEQAHKLGFYRILCLGLLLAEELGGATLPSHIRDLFVHDPKVQALAREIEPQIIMGGNPARLNRFPIFYLRCRERWPHRLYYVLDQVFMPRWVDWHVLPLPGALFPLYFLIRPLRLLVKFSWIYLSTPLKR
jgi:hypothetical protein